MGTQKAPEPRENKTEWTLLGTTCRQDAEEGPPVLGMDR